MSSTDPYDELEAGQKAMANKQWPTAISAFRSVVQAWPEDWRTLELLGHALKESGEKEEAVDSYATALELADEPNEIGLLSPMRSVFIWAIY
ncbi:tetratricopeptide repeat protein [Altererythrobacter lutimaris]|uniref:Tetratricopeptide repeat protein n=1 Tax=Altererythrobacter lutimaris TaxID=2743979 RepID=A0A850HAF8_9SPHN|nr:hypothetical protein [Altererythrobacter lutimaris]NVE93448.1 hypothetical protein [Altererythrobacter lutimaris]